MEKYALQKFDEILIYATLSLLVTFFKMFST